jgi:hypothetical protein
MLGGSFDHFFSGSPGGLGGSGKSIDMFSSRYRRWRGSSIANLNDFSTTPCELLLAPLVVPPPPPCPSSLRLHPGYPLVRSSLLYDSCAGVCAWPDRYICATCRCAQHVRTIHRRSTDVVASRVTHWVPRCVPPLSACALTLRT